MVFRIDLKIFIILLLYLVTKQVNYYAFIMFFAFIHESGHLLAGILLKMKVKRIYIMPLGFSIEFKLNERDYNKKILKSNLLEIKKLVVATAGPLTNVLIIIISLLLKDYKELIIYSNLAIILFNMLPIYPLDRWKNFKINFEFII